MADTPTYLVRAIGNPDIKGTITFTVLGPKKTGYGKVTGTTGKVITVDTSPPSFASSFEEVAEWVLVLLHNAAIDEQNADLYFEIYEEEEVVPDPPPPAPPPPEEPAPPPVPEPPAEPEYKFDPPPKTDAPEQSPTGSEEGNARIWNVFEPTIVLDEISLPESQGEGRKTQRIEDIASVRYPLIKINDYFLGQEEIDSMTIDSNGKLPKITLTVSFRNELFLSKNMPKDGDIISVMIQSLSEILKPIRNDYVVTGVVPTRKSADGGSVSMTLFGRLFIPGWSSFLGDNAEKGTTMEVLKRAAQAIGLGFSTNEEETDDLQVWIACNTPAEFISSTVECSWKDENSFFDWWIDVYYNINFVNVQKQLLAEETEVDIGAFITNIVRGWNWGTKTEDTTGTPKVFSNYEGYRASSFFINRWRPINRSSEITFTYGTSLIA